MFQNIREKWGKAEAVPNSNETVEVSVQAVELAKKVVLLSRDPVPGPNPQLDSAIKELAAELSELGLEDLDSRTVQEKAYEIERQLD